VLTAEGGHPGNDPQHASIRRWTAPRDGVVSIEAELEHPTEKGDGVRGRIVSNRKGRLGEWLVYNEKMETKVERIEVKGGETIDFVVDCRGNVSYDSFTWAPVIKYLPLKSSAKTAENRAEGHPNEPAPDARREWNAKADFNGPPPPKPRMLSPWEKYAQVLLFANELVFVD